MSNRIKFTPLEKKIFVLKFRELNISFAEFSRLYNVERTAIHRWSIKYDHGGLEALEEIRRHTQYSPQTLINAVEDYLTGNFTMLEIVKKYNLSGDSVLRRWLKWYNTPKWNLKLGEFMARKKVSKDKKLELVLQYIYKTKPTKEIIEENSITKRQLRYWVEKYKRSGIDALEDKRGIRKNERGLSKEQILIRENKELEKKNKMLEAELLLIKKLKELERGVM